MDSFNNDVSDLRIAIIGYGPVASYVEEKFLRGRAKQILIVAIEGEHTEQFKTEEHYNANVLEVKRENLDRISIDNAMMKLEVVPAASGDSEDSGELKGLDSHKKTVDVALVDMGSLNDHVVERVSPHAATTIAITDDSGNIETLRKLGATMAFSMIKETGDKLGLVVFNGLTAYRVLKISQTLYSVEIVTPENFDGKTVDELQKEFEVRIVEVVQSTPHFKGKSKVVDWYEEHPVPFPKSEYCLAVASPAESGGYIDTAITVVGNFGKIRNFAKKTE